jgi:hypothetical protein
MKKNCRHIPNVLRRGYCIFDIRAIRIGAEAEPGYSIGKITPKGESDPTQRRNYYEPYFKIKLVM